MSAVTPIALSPAAKTQIEEAFGTQWRIEYFGACVMLTHRDRESEKQVAFARRAHEPIGDFLRRIRSAIA